MAKFSFNQYLFAWPRWFAVIAVFVFVVAFAGVAGAGSTSLMESVFTSPGGMPFAPMTTDMTAVQVQPGSGQFDNQPNTNLARVRPYSYITVVGFAFTPISNTIVASGTNGCIYATFAGLVSTRLDLPQDATIMQISLYYSDNDTELNLFGALVSYDVLNGGTSTPLAILSSTGSPGTSVLSSDILSITVNNVSNSYMLLVSLPTSSNVQLCGMRVAYYPPPYLVIQ